MQRQLSAASPFRIRFAEFYLTAHVGEASHSTCLYQILEMKEDEEDQIRSQQPVRRKDAETRKGL